MIWHQRKTCVKCKIEKSGTEFYVKKSKNKDGTVRTCLHSLCKSCYLMVCRQWDDKNRDKRRAYSRRFHRRKKFGVESIDYLNMLEKQDYGCAICGATEVETGRRLDIDHCHNSKYIRGLLCSNCNNGIGRFKDNPRLLRRAAQYIETTERVEAA